MQEPCDMEHGSQNRETPEIPATLPDILEEDASSDVCIVIILYGCLNLYIVLFTAFIPLHLRKRPFYWGFLPVKIQESQLPQNKQLQ